ncbi:MAG: hypothetical protein FIA92_13545 [Chloroflexi bacterium]|nr:hypothetical protein [Chloroflexota bacterium]
MPVRWRSDDPESDAKTVRKVARLAVDWAEAWGIGDEALLDPDTGLIALVGEVFKTGRACGARAVAHVIEGTPIPRGVPKAPYAIGTPERVVGSFGTYLESGSGVQPVIFPGVKEQER